MAVEGETVVEEATLPAKNTAAREDSVADHSNTGNNGHTRAPSVDDACNNHEANSDTASRDRPDRESLNGHPDSESGTEEEPEESDGPRHSPPLQEDPGGHDKERQRPVIRDGSVADDDDAVAEEKEKAAHRSPSDDTKQQAYESDDRKRGHSSHDSDSDSAGSEASRPRASNDRQRDQDTGGATSGAAKNAFKSAETGAGYEMDSGGSEPGHGGIKEEQDDDRAQDSDNPDMALIASLVAAAAASQEPQQEEPAIAENEAYQQVLKILLLVLLSCEPSMFCRPVSDTHVELLTRACFTFVLVVIFFALQFFRWAAWSSTRQPCLSMLTGMADTTRSMNQSSGQQVCTRFLPRPCLGFFVKLIFCCVFVQVAVPLACLFDRKKLTPGFARQWHESWG
jgi:hypothetical protein